jgi:hypothetical protein
MPSVGGKMVIMRVFALGASFMAMSGCSLFWSLGGLQGDACEGGVCVDRGGVPPQPDAADDLGTQPVDSSSMNEAGRDTASPEASANESGGPGDANDANPACTPPTPPTLDDCTGIVALPAPPVIDGVLDCGVPLWPMPLEGWIGPGAMPSTVQASLAIAWRTDGLYFFVSVTGLGPTRYPPPPGDPSWCGDAVELFVDDDGQYTNPPSYDDPGTIQLIADSPTDMATSTSSGEMFRDGNDLGPWTGQFTVVRTSDGFDAEAFVVASDLGLTSWSLASQVGMDVSFDIGDPANQTASCPRLGQFTIQVPVTDASCDQAACNVYEFCTPQLLP